MQFIVSFRLADAWTSNRYQPVWSVLSISHPKFSRWVLGVIMQYIWKTFTKTPESYIRQDFDGLIFLCLGELSPDLLFLFPNFSVPPCLRESYDDICSRGIQVHKVFQSCFTELFESGTSSGLETSDKFDQVKSTCKDISFEDICHDRVRLDCRLVRYYVQERLPTLISRSISGVL